MSKELDLADEPAKLNISNIHGSKTKSCEAVYLQMESLGSEEWSAIVDVYAVDRLPLAKASEALTLDMARRYAHLVDLASESIPDGEVGTLVGRGVPEARWVLDQTVRRSKDPYAQKTPFV